MKAEMILKADVLDILFENRNQQYGAYVLRKQYHLRMKRAITGSLLLAALLMVVITNMRQQTVSWLPQPGERDDVILRPPAIQPVQPQVKQQVTPMVPKKLFASSQPAPGTELGRTPVTGTQTEFTGNNNGGSPVTGTPVGPGEGGPVVPPADTTAIVKPEPVVVKPVDNQPVDHAEVMPEYPGGRAAMMAYLQDKLQDYVTDEGEAKKALVTFVIEKDGSLTQVMVAVPGDAGFDTKVVKVFNKMPKWKPASQGGHPVRIYYQIPVQLVPAEE